MLAVQVVNFLADCLVVGLVSIPDIVTILSSRRMMPFEGYTFHALLESLMVLVMKSVEFQTSGPTVINMIQKQAFEKGMTWVRPHFCNGSGLCRTRTGLRSFRCSN